MFTISVYAYSKLSNHSTLSRFLNKIEAYANKYSFSNLATKAQQYLASKENDFFEKKAIINTICDVRIRNINKYQKTSGGINYD